VCVGERIVFLKNDKALGVANGQTATVVGLRVDKDGTPVLVVQVDGVTGTGGHGAGSKKIVHVPTAQYNHLDHAYCLTNHKSQGRTYEQTFVLVNPLLADRQWSYVACSRSRFQTSLYVNASALAVLDDSHQKNEQSPPMDKAALLDALSKRMSISHAKGTSLDYEAQEELNKQGGLKGTSSSSMAHANDGSSAGSANRVLAVHQAMQTLQGKVTDISRSAMQALLGMGNKLQVKQKIAITASPTKELDQEYTP
jgi:hypothetical protein